MYCGHANIYAKKIAGKIPAIVLPAFLFGIDNC